MSALNLRLLPGFRFQPTDSELVGYYLRRKLAGSCEVPQSLIRDFDVYSTEPWKLQSDLFQFQSEEKDMHFFTPRRPISTRSVRADRTAGCGFWLGCGKDNHIKDGSKVIGHKTQLTFMIREEKKKTNWIMHEFRLHSPSDATKFDDMVLCKIYKKKTNKCREEETYKDSATAAVALAVGEKEEDDGGARLVKRRRVEECGLMAGCGETGIHFLVNTESFSQHVEQEIFTDVAAASVALAVGEKEEEGKGSLVKRKRVEEPEIMLSPLLSTSSGACYDHPLSSTSIIPMTGVAAAIDAHTSLEDIFTDVDLTDLPPWEEIVGNDGFTFDDYGSPQPLGDNICSHSAGVGEEEQHGKEEEMYTACATAAVLLAVGEKEEEGEGRLVERRRVEENGSMADCDETGTHGLVNTESSSQPDMPALASYEEPEALHLLASDVDSIPVFVGEHEKAEKEERRVRTRLLEEGTHGLVYTESSVQHVLSLPSLSSSLPSMSWEELEDFAPLTLNDFHCDFSGISSEDCLSDLLNGL